MDQVLPHYASSFSIRVAIVKQSRSMIALGQIYEEVNVISVWEADRIGRGAGSRERSK